MAKGRKRQSLAQVNEDMLNIFNRSQQVKNKSKCAKEFMQHYDKMHGEPLFEEFMTTFINITKSVLSSERTSPYTKRTLDFVAYVFKNIITYEEEKEKKRLESIVAEDMNRGANASQDDSMEEDEEFDELGQQAFDMDRTIVDERYLSPISTVDLLIRNHLLKFLYADNINVRYNATSLIKKTLESFEEIDQETFKELKTGMTDRTFDKEKSIRALAVLGLEKLQNSEDENDLVMRSLKFHLLRDPDPAVRLCALKTIAITSETLRCLFLATRDSNIAIRKTAYGIIAEQCEILNFNSEDRYILLMNGIYEREESVLNVVLKKLIPNWLKRLDDNILKFVEFMNFKKDLAFSEKLLTSYFSSLLKAIENDGISKFHQLVFDFQTKYLDEYNLLTKENLTEENSYFWYQLCQFCKKNNIIYKKQLIQNENEIPDEDDQEERVQFETIDLIDHVLPQIPNYCKFIDGFTAKMLEENAKKKNSQNNSPVGKFVFTQLLNIGKLMKIKDDAQWNFVLITFRKIILVDEFFDIFDSGYIEDIITIFGNYTNFSEDHEKFLDFIYELFNGINSPESIISDTQAEDFRVRMNELDDQINERYERRSRVMNQEICEMEDMEVEMDKIKEEIDQMIIEKQNIIAAQSASETSSCTQPPRMETDQKVLQRCLHICYGFFLTGRLKKEIERLPALINTLVLPALESNDLQIRTLAVKTLALYCLPSIDFTNHFIKVFFEIIDTESYGETRVEALKFIFDFLCYHGFKCIKFIHHDYKNTELHKSTNFDDESQDNILARCNQSEFGDVFAELVERLLAEPLYDIDKRTNAALVERQMFEVTVKGVCKIMSLGRFCSSEFLARLIVIFFVYNKVEMSLKQYLEGFFYVYSQDFQKYMTDLFGINNPFEEAREQCMNVIFNEMQVQDKDGSLQKKLDNFFKTFIQN